MTDPKPCLPGCLRPCEATFEQLAKEAPELLIAWVQTGYRLDAADLSFACEALGRVDLDEAREQLCLRLGHDSPLVREGAVYGLAAQLEGAPRVAWWPGMLVGHLRARADDDPSPGVREAAREALDAVVNP